MSEQPTETEVGGPLAMTQGVEANPLATKKRARKQSAKTRAQTKPIEGADEWLDCARYGELAEMLRLLRRNPQLLDVTDEMGNSALHRACANGHVSVLHELISRGAAVAANKMGSSPMQWAKFNGQTEAADLMFELSLMLEAERNAEVEIVRPKRDASEHAGALEDADGDPSDSEPAEPTGEPSAPNEPTRAESAVGASADTSEIAGGLADALPTDRSEGLRSLCYCCDEMGFGWCDESGFYCEACWATWHNTDRASRADVAGCADGHANVSGAVDLSDVLADQTNSRSSSASPRTSVAAQLVEPALKAKPPSNGADGGWHGGPGLVESSSESGDGREFTVVGRGARNAKARHKSQAQSPDSRQASGQPRVQCAVTPAASSISSRTVQSGFKKLQLKGSKRPWEVRRAPEVARMQPTVGVQLHNTSYPATAGSAGGSEGRPPPSREPRNVWRGTRPASASRVGVRELYKRAAAADIHAMHLLGEDVASLSLAQLEIVQDFHMAALSDVIDSKVQLAAAGQCL